ncbi:extracellular catalytic domain type 1 short-chain-length polyhydroxyalkanoate depolymerase [Dactylosporangium matsuzakiense]|uniref:Hydrolase n=1 Tax=Dactylosporangium matsuzakiense TaxID=53360 RepID=A0A9W6NQ04_9ACTN|nr:alpha/beta fold hydrolase [Dactylosporangium matsuzakiense]UWZ42806.1 alpha/beta fold hydrolase [Dactylosporangium matsuzakiense]GLL04766.1 hydrolase [Dactylosporangium matsuzakiense]
MRLALVLLLALAGLTTCRDRQPDPQPSDTVAGRHYQVHVPVGITGKAPLVVMLHGGGGNGEQFAQQTHMNDIADREKFLTVFPDGSGRTRLLTWNAGTCCAYARDTNVDDVAFIAAMLDQIIRDHPVDASRVFVTGFSNGAMLAYRLGCELTDRIAAIAPVSGALNIDGCHPSKALPAYIIHGTADDVVPIGGGAPQRDIPGGGRSWDNRAEAESVALLAKNNGCTGSGQVTHPAGITRTSYDQCTNNAKIRFDAIDGGKHAWPGGAQPREAADTPSNALDASEQIWQFFATL